MSIIMDVYVTEMPDGSRWGVKIHYIAYHRAETYKDEFEGDVGRSLEEDTIPLFESDPFAIGDWAQNNLNWDDINGVAFRIEGPEIDYQEGWINGEHWVESVE